MRNRAGTRVLPGLAGVLGHCTAHVAFDVDRAGRKWQEVKSSQVKSGQVLPGTANTWRVIEQCCEEEAGSKLMPATA